MRRYKEQKKNNKIIRIIEQIILIFAIATISIVLYDTYINIEVVDENYETEKLAQEINTDASQDISGMLENVSDSVVRYI